MSKIDEMAAELQISPKELVKQVVEREGSFEEAARVFECYPNTVKQRLAKYGLKAIPFRGLRVVEKS